MREAYKLGEGELESIFSPAKRREVVERFLSQVTQIDEVFAVSAIYASGLKRRLVVTVEDGGNPDIERRILDIFESDPINPSTIKRLITRPLVTSFKNYANDTEKVRNYASAKSDVVLWSRSRFRVR